MRSLDADVLIIGSGAGGGVLAGTLTELMPGKKIIVAEKGGHCDAESFTQREWDARVMFADKGRRSTADGAIPVKSGECVGGGTLINVTLCHDPRPDVWARWRNELGLQQFSFDAAANDYGVPQLNMATALGEVKQRLNIHPSADSELNDNNRIFESGCAAIGMSSRRWERNVRDCIGCGYCSEGCVYDRKQGADQTYIADAMQRGAQFIHSFDVTSIEFAKRNGALAAIGPSLPVIGIMDRTIVNYRGVSGVSFSDHYAQSHGLYFECLFGHPVYGAAAVPGLGEEHFAVMQKYDRLAGFGVMLVDTVDARNRVEVTPDRMRIHYQLSEGDRERLRFGAERAVELMFGGGAGEVLFASDELPPFRNASEARRARELRFVPHRTTLTSAHCQSTVKMSEDPRRGAIDSRCESHAVRNLVVCDASSFPTSCGVNPMVAILTLARYQGRRIAAEWGRYA